VGKPGKTTPPRCRQELTIAAISSPQAHRSSVLAFFSGIDEDFPGTTPRRLFTSMKKM
jgi:hypothetical protein